MRLIHPSPVQPLLESADAVPADVYLLIRGAGKDDFQFGAGEVDQVADGCRGDDIFAVDAEEGDGIQLFGERIEGVVDDIISMVRGMQVRAFIHAVKIKYIGYVHAADMFPHFHHEA